MSTLFEKIQTDLEAALRAKAEPDLGVLRMLKSDLQYEMTKTGVKSLGDPEVQALIQRSIKKRKESIDQFQKGGRQDLADKEAAEIAVLDKYLPAAVSEKQIAEAIEEAVEATVKAAGTPGPGDVGKLMGRVMGKFKGQNIDGNKVKEMVQKRLGA
ncbi:MAG: GatB/YqeY domain-containing protein [Spirochaetia bacterium]|nr:GatB/YqeY domain-containing protein [Spirochaetia bacterium]